MTLMIKKEGETKSFFIFREDGVTHTYDILKTSLASALQDLQRWQNNPGATNFTTQLYNLMSKADSINLRKLFNGFPTRTTAYILWFYSIDKEKLFKEYALQENIDNETKL